MIYEYKHLSWMGEDGETPLPTPTEAMIAALEDKVFPFGWRRDPACLTTDGGSLFLRRPYDADATGENERLRHKVKGLEDRLHVLEKIVLAPLTDSELKPPAPAATVHDMLTREIGGTWRLQLESGGA